MDGDDGSLVISSLLDLPLGVLKLLLGSMKIKLSLQWCKGNPLVEINQFILII